MSVENAKTSTDASATRYPSDLPQRLTEAEVRMRLYEAVERVLTDADDLKTGCLQVLRVACESLGAQNGALLFNDPSISALVWPEQTMSQESWAPIRLSPQYGQHPALDTPARQEPMRDDGRTCARA